MVLKQIVMNTSAIRISVTILIALFGMSVYAQNDMIGIISPESGTYMGENLTIDYHTGNWTVLNMGNSNGQIGNGLFNERYLITSVDSPESSDIQFELYPNPTAKLLTIKTASSGKRPSTYRILNAIGEEVLRSNWPDSEMSQSIDLSHLTAEIYILLLHDDDNNLIRSYKLIKID